MKKALVFSGGGSKGAYQIGVWKALRQLNIKFDIVTGASIGAINACMYACNEYFLAKRLWKKIRTSDLFDYDIGGELTKDEYINLIKEMIINGGVSFDKAGIFLSKYINEYKLRKSKIDYGLITVSYNAKKPKALTKDSIPYGKLIDYISASSIFYPFIAKKEIDGEYFIDGGFYDNIPINLAIDMGATEILAVDLNAIGFVQKPKNKDVKIDYIKFDDDKSSMLSFDPKTSKTNIKLGYNDTMKHFKKLDGNIYTFKKDNLEKNYNDIENKFIMTLKEIILEQNNKTIISEIINVGKFNKLFSNIRTNKNIKHEINEAIEYLGDLFNLPKEKIYDINKFNRLLIKKANELSYIKLNKNLKGKFLISYMYNRYNDTKSIKDVKKEFYNIALLFPKEFLAGLYLISLVNRYSILVKTDEIYDEILKTLNLK